MVKFYCGVLIFFYNDVCKGHSSDCLQTVVDVDHAIICASFNQ